MSYRVKEKPALGLGAQLLALCVGVLAFVGINFGRDGFTVPFWRERIWEIAFLPQVGPFLIWLALLPICLLFSRGRTVDDPAAAKELSSSTSTSVPESAVLFFFFTALTLGIQYWFGNPIADLPPLFHDEYSYLFQAKTLLLGRVTNPPVTSPELFLQTHVLGTPVFVSRYFPGTGIWLAPFVALAKPVYGEWLACALASGFLALAGRRFSRAAGLLAGITAACAPGMIVFGNLLLSVMPTILALSIFLWAYFGMFGKRGLAFALIAGGAMGAAFLTRPMTAVGFGFPFALHAIFRAWRKPMPQDFSRVITLTICFGIFPVLLVAYNYATIGKVLESPYGLYMNSLTPSHEYGFYNVDRGVLKRGPNTDLPYDQWVENHTPERMTEVVGIRWQKLLVWSIGMFPSLIAIGILLIRLRHSDDRELLLLLCLLGLTFAYAPYWYAGILDFSYIAEAMPALLLLMAIQIGELFHRISAAGKRLLAIWWLTLPILASAINVALEIPKAYAPSTFLVQPRRKAAQIEELIDKASKDGPILVLVAVDRKTDLQSTTVHNDPDLNGPVIRIWLTSEQAWRAIHQSQPNRTVYVLTPNGERGVPTLVKIAEPIAKTGR